MDSFCTGNTIKVDTVHISEAMILCDTKESIRQETCINALAIGPSNNDDTSIRVFILWVFPTKRYLGMENGVQWVDN